MTLELITRLAREAAGADLVAVLLAAEPGTLAVEILNGDPNMAQTLEDSAMLEDAFNRAVAGVAPVVADESHLVSSLGHRVLLAPMRTDPEAASALLVGWSTPAWPTRSRPP